MFKVPNDFRIKDAGPNFKSDDNDGNNGAFKIHPLKNRRDIYVIASDGLGWEHVSVSIRQGKDIKIPTWDEMNYVKDMFWGEEDTVIQFHPRKSEYVNVHEKVLHMWRPIDRKFPTPDMKLV